jgi:hypothetical protein
VYLRREGCRSNRTGVQVKSNKGERALVAAAVHADELAFAEAHVRLVRQSHGARGGRACAAAANMSEANESVEVCDLRRVADIGHRVSGIQRVMVDGYAKGLEWDNASRDRSCKGAAARFGAVIVVIGKCRAWM